MDSPGNRLDQDAFLSLGVTSPLLLEWLTAAVKEEFLEASNPCLETERGEELFSLSILKEIDIPPTQFTSETKCKLSI